MTQRSEGNRPRNEKLIAARLRVPSPSGSGQPMSTQEVAEAMNAYLWAEHLKTPRSPQPTILDHRFVSGYENGRFWWPSRHYRAAFRHVLRATDAELGFRRSRQRTGSSTDTVTPQVTDALADGADERRPEYVTTRQQALKIRSTTHEPAHSDDSHGQLVSTAELVGQLTKEDLAMDRREAARIVSGLLLGAPLLERVEEWLAAVEPRPSRRQHAGIGYQELEQIEHAARIFRAWDNQFGGGLRRKAVIGQLAEVADELREFTHPSDLRRRLHGVMAQLAATAATMSWDSGQGGAAQRYYLLALRAAAAAGDRAFAANVLAGMARQQFYLGLVAEGLELVRVAQDRVNGHATPAVRAMLYTREAWGYAMQGRLAAFRRVTSRAEDCLRDVQPDSEPYWISYFNEAELAGVTGGRLLTVAHQVPACAENAAAWLSQAVALRGSNALRSAALDQIGFAEVKLIQGELDEAARLGHQALDTVERTQSSRVRVKLAELRRYAETWASAPPMTALCERIGSVLRVSRSR